MRTKWDMRAIWENDKNVILEFNKSNPSFSLKYANDIFEGFTKNMKVKSVIENSDDSTLEINITLE